MDVLDGLFVIVIFSLYNNVKMFKVMRHIVSQSKYYERLSANKNKTNIVVEMNRSC